MQLKLDKKNEEMRKLETEHRQQETSARQEHLSALKNDRDAMMAELDKLRAELALQAKQKPAGPRHDTMAPTSSTVPAQYTSSYGGAHTSAPQPTYGQPVAHTQQTYNMGQSQPPQQQQRQEFEAARPKARRGIE